MWLLGTFDLFGCGVGLEMFTGISHVCLWLVGCGWVVLGVAHMPVCVRMWLNYIAMCKVGLL